MNCTYCFYRDEMKCRATADFGEMSEQTLKNVIRRTLPCADTVASFAFQGGEPTLRGLDFFRKAVMFEKQYNSRGVRVINALQTNAQSLDEEWCRFLHDEDFIVGVSLDGTRDINDLYRRRNDGGSAFDRTLSSIKLLEKFGVRYNILTVVTDELCRAVDEVYDFYRTSGFEYQQYVACISPLCNDNDDCRREYLSPGAYGSFLISLFRLWRSDYLKGKAPSIRMFDNYLSLLHGCRPESCEQNGVCGEHYVAEADGSVYPCDFYVLDGWRLGNLNTDRLDSLDRARRKARFAETSLQSETCRDCRYFRLCRGGCRRNRDRETGRNRFCESYRAFFDCCLDELRSLAYMN